MTAPMADTYNTLSPDARADQVIAIINGMTFSSDDGAEGWAKHVKPVIAAAIRAAVEAERAACAIIADDDDGEICWSGTDRNVATMQLAARGIAEAIRARGSK